MKCSFCNGKISSGTGKMFVMNTGKIFWFCSSRCEKNHMMGRDPKKFKWTRKKTA